MLFSMCHTRWSKGYFWELGYTLKVWDLATGKELHTLTGHSELGWSVCVTPDGQQVISGSEDKTLKVWDLATGERNTHPHRS
jgi:WD40 repeat protein